MVLGFFSPPQGKPGSEISSEEKKEKKSEPNHEEDAGHISEWHLAKGWGQTRRGQRWGHGEVSDIHSLGTCQWRVGVRVTQ